MRWPLRYQILVPMIGVVVITSLGASSLTAYLAARRVRVETERQLRELGRTIDEGAFPLTDRVLDQLQGLSGAEFVVSDLSGQPLVPATWEGPIPTSEPVPWPELRLNQAASRPSGPCFHAAMRLASRGSQESPRVLHVFYPQDRLVRASRDAVWPPFIVGGISLVITSGLGFWIASRASRPLDELRRQVTRIAARDFSSPVRPPPRNDELRDLALAVNQMADMLRQYELDIRRNERMRALAQLSGGIAHQLRNAATGCRMALDIHATECGEGPTSESLAVAKRQLVLMEQYVQRFLTLGKPPGVASPRVAVDLNRLLLELLPLVQPAATHAGVELRFEPAGNPVVWGDGKELEQLALNLILNGLEATSQAAASQPRERPPWVSLRVESDGGWTRLLVEDSGAGPASDVQDKLFEPFVSEKPDGTGLGLAVAQEIARHHGGHIRWLRANGLTTFVVELPGRLPEASKGE